MNDWQIANSQTAGFNLCYLFHCHCSYLKLISKDSLVNLQSVIC